jgi:isopentenyldiphosphate isomerase
MESELIKTFDEDGNELGIATREEVHKQGYWHETFHCWFISRKEDRSFLYFQLRSELKKDYPNLLDITAAGHILAHESVQDGIREVSEEVGIEVSFQELSQLGVIKYSVVNGELLDKELANVFLNDYQGTMDDFKLQMEEVSGIVKIELASFADLYFGEKSEVIVEGFVLDKDGNRIQIKKSVTKEHFVPHEDSYYVDIINKINKYLHIE